MDHVLVEIDLDHEIEPGHVHATTAIVEAKMRSLAIMLLYEVCRLQKLDAKDLRTFFSLTRARTLLMGSALQGCSMSRLSTIYLSWWSRQETWQTSRSITRLSSCLYAHLTSGMAFWISFSAASGCS